MIARCDVCGARDGQRVWRLKSNWRLCWPGPQDPREDRTKSVEQRDIESYEFVRDSGLYEEKLDVVKLDAGRCAWCLRHLKSDPKVPCPRCVPKAPPSPYHREPCPLCRRTGQLTGVVTQQQAIDYIVKAAGLKI